jgi:hypothetical protein
MQYAYFPQTPRKFQPNPPAKYIISPHQPPLPPKFDLLAKFLSWRHPEGPDKSAKILADTLRYVPTTLIKITARDTSDVEIVVSD